jgi:hypothetical protein
MALPENLKHGDIDNLLTQLEQNIERLRVRYEQYFMGVDRLPPEQLRKDVVRQVFQLEQTFIRNTAQKFRLQSLVQRFNTYKTYWNRIMRQIEEGTFKRDVNRAQRNQERRERREAQEDVYELDLDMDVIEDLSELEREFDQMDLRGQLSGKPMQPEPASQPVPVVSAEEKERIRQARLREIQAKLMAEMGGGEPAPAPAPAPASASKPAPAPVSAAPAAQPVSAASAAEEERKRKLEEMRRKLQGGGAAPQPAASSELPTGGADYDKLARLRQMKERLGQQPAEPRAVERAPINRPAAQPQPANTAASAPRVIERRPSANSDDDHSRRVYENLIEAKRKCNEPTNNLSYEAVRKSMDKQREQLLSSNKARDVEFKVVIKNGKAFLKPEAKE